jgi:predicted metal-dependent TIM-barrel fold hydrolase
MYSRTTDDHDAMSKSGIEGIAQPSFWLGSPRTSVNTFEDYWEQMISYKCQNILMKKRFIVMISKLQYI